MELQPYSAKATVGILILNYHQPEATLACVRRLLEREGDGSRILWIENDAGRTQDSVLALLDSSGLPWIRLEASTSPLPEAGVIGFLPVRDNLGYGAGNNVGLRFLERHQVEFAWVMNNDTLLERGSSADLVAAARTRPEIGIWGVTLRSPEGMEYSGATLGVKDFGPLPVHGARSLETDPRSYVSGCSLFFLVSRGSAVGFLPEDYFLYYEDPAFSMEFRKRGFPLSASAEVTVLHAESLSTGHRSPLMEYYSRRNRWVFIERYFPEDLRPQRRKVWYRFQSLLFRGAFRRTWIEWLAFLDGTRHRLGKTFRGF